MRARHTASRQNSLEVGFDGDGGEVRGKALCRFEILALDVDLPGPNPLLLSELMQDVLGRIGGLGFSVPSNTALVPLAGYDDGKGCRSHSLNMVGDGCFRAVTERPRSRFPTANGVWLLTPSRHGYDLSFANASEADLEVKAISLGFRRDWSHVAIFVRSHPPTCCGGRRCLDRSRRENAPKSFYL
ncbi:protein of unknown function [Methylorubrum extorquens]|uniref:Uncharacterized protein n=1 Tax=Methylorubrum extorquens TaxID=408 RepID=A0A2N9AWA6_METEX|nr:protein of unknown function [Methylorubrum extorquens]